MIYALLTEQSPEGLRTMLAECHSMPAMDDQGDDLWSTDPINVMCLGVTPLLATDDLMTAVLMFPTRRDYEDFETLHDCRDLMIMLEQAY